MFFSVRSHGKSLHLETFDGKFPEIFRKLSDWKFPQPYLDNSYNYKTVTFLRNIVCMYTTVQSQSNKLT